MRRTVLAFLVPLVAPTSPSTASLRRRGFALATVVVAAGLAGCLGAAVGPGIPKAALDEHGWAIRDQSTTALYGVAEVATLQYGPPAAGDAAGVLVVSATDVPFLDEARFVPAQIDKFAAREGITLTPAGNEEITLANLAGRTVHAKVYDVEGAPIPARAIVVETHCDTPSVFLVAVGYGALPSTSLLGRDVDLYGEAKDLVQAVACGV